MEKTLKVVSFSNIGQGSIIAEFNGVAFPEREVDAAILNLSRFRVIGINEAKSQVVVVSLEAISVGDRITQDFPVVKPAGFEKTNPEIVLPSIALIEDSSAWIGSRVRVTEPGRKAVRVVCDPQGEYVIVALRSEIKNTNRRWVSIAPSNMVSSYLLESD